MNCVDSLREYIQRYTYGKFDVLSRDVCVSISHRFRKVRIGNFLRHGEGVIQGECSELMSSLYLDRNQWPNLHFIRAAGNDLEFFSEQDDRHYFLLVAENDPMEGEPFLDECSDLRTVCDTNPLVVDPSLGTVGRLSDLGYRVSALHNVGFPLSYSRDRVIPDKHTVPIGITENGLLVELGIVFSLEKVLAVQFRQSGKKFAYALDHRFVDSILGKSRIMAAVENLRCRRPIQAKGNLVAKDRVTIN